MTCATPPPSNNIRQGVRALVVEAGSGDVLLVRFEFATATVWSTPGGGIDEGETPLAALHRELHEELGLLDVAIGPHVWSRTHLIPMPTGHDGQTDRIHLVVGPRFEPDPAIGWEALRHENVHEIRWWSRAEIDAVTAANAVTAAPRVARRVLFAPRRLGELLAALERDGPPPHPIDTGV